MALESMNMQVYNTMQLKDQIRHNGYNGQLDQMPDWYLNATNNMTPEEREKFLDTLLNQHNAELAYQRSLPGQQLSNLMATGMSRSAALQMLQGAQYQPATAQPVGGQTANALGQIQAGLQMGGQFASLVFGGFSAGLNSVAVLSQAAANAEQVEASRQNRRINQYHVDAKEKVAQTIQAMDNWHVRTGEDYADSLGEQIDKMRECSDMPDVYDCANQFNDNLRSPLFFAYMRDAYRQLRMDKQELANEIVRDNASAEFASLNNDKLAMDYVNAWQAFQNAIKQGALTDEQIKIAQATYNNTLAQFGLINAQKSLVENQANSEFWASQQKQEDLLFTRDYLHPVQVKRLLGDLKTLNELEKGDYFKQSAWKMIKEQDAAYTLAQINAMQAIDFKSFYESDATDMYKSQYCLQQLGVLDMNVNKIGVFGFEVKQFTDPVGFGGSLKPHFYPSSQSAVADKKKK